MLVYITNDIMKKWSTLTFHREHAHQNSDNKEQISNHPRKLDLEMLVTDEAETNKPITSSDRGVDRIGKREEKINEVIISDGMQQEILLIEEPRTEEIDKLLKDSEDIVPESQEWLDQFSLVNFLFFG